MNLDRTKIVGLTLGAQINFTSSAGVIHDVLSTILGFEEPSLQVTCGFPDIDDWHQPLEINSFKLTGIFTDAQPKPSCKKLRLSSVGASLTGYKTVKFDENHDDLVEGTAYGYELFGTMHVDMPSTALPLELEFKIAEVGGAVTLSAAMDPELGWESAFGVPNLVVSVSSSCAAMGSTLLTDGHQKNSFMTLACPYSLISPRQQTLSPSSLKPASMSAPSSSSSLVITQHPEILASSPTLRTLTSTASRISTTTFSTPSLTCPTWTSPSKIAPLRLTRAKGLR